MTSGAEIVFDRVTKRYAGREGAALEDLSFTIPAGTFCVLVGPSGGGKTTALKLVNRLIPFDEGDIRIDGRSIKELEPVELRRGIGYVIQQVGLFPHMTIGDNIATVPQLLGWPKATDPRADGGAPRAGRARAGGREALPGAALRRPAPAGRARPRPGRRPAGPPDGRALRRARPDHPRAAAGRAAPPAPRDGEDDHLRHPRHRRGDQDGRPDRDPPHRRRSWPSTTRRTRSSPTPPTTSSRSSSARTARSAGSRCAGSPRSSSTRCRTRTRPTVQAAASTTVRNAISLLLESGADRLVVVGDDGRDLGVLTLARAAELLS